MSDVDISGYHYSSPRAVDLSVEGIQRAQAAYPDLKLANGSAYDELAGKYGQFPVVLSLEVVEHVYAPRRYARTVFELLVAGPDESKREGQSSRKRSALFLSRIHPKKGLLNLIEARARVRPADWRLCLAGPDEGGYLAEVMRRIRALGLEESMKYMGVVEGDAKAALFEGADLFVLPSFSENFGVVVVEALTYGVPVITTRGAPWEGLPLHGCGWWIEPTAEALTKTLQEVLSMDSATLRAMGEQGRAYAGEFDWTHIASQTAEVYRWVLRQGPMPTCIVQD